MYHTHGSASVEYKMTNYRLLQHDVSRSNPALDRGHAYKHCVCVHVCVLECVLSLHPARSPSLYLCYMALYCSSHCLFLDAR